MSGYEPGVDPMLFVHAAMRDGMRMARIKLWGAFIGATVLAVCALLIVVAKFLAGF